MRILFSCFLWQSRATYFPVAEVLYHCAAQVHRRSMARAQRWSNAFHLGPNEMHSLCTLSPRVKLQLPSAIYSTATFGGFFQCTWHVPNRGMFATRDNFSKVLLSKSHMIYSSPLSPIFKSTVIALLFLNMCSSLPSPSGALVKPHQSQVPIPSPQAAKYVPSFLDACSLRPFHQALLVSPQNSWVLDSVYLRPSRKNIPNPCAKADGTYY